MIGDDDLGQIEYFSNNTFIKILPNLHTNKIRHLKYLPFKIGHVASASYDNTVNIWHTQTWTSIQRYTGHSNRVYSVDQIDNDTMVSGSEDKTIRIWRISTSETLKTIYVTVEVFVVRVFTSKYKQVICGLNDKSDNLQIYNYETCQLIRTLNGHSHSVNSIEMLSEQFMASGGDDERVIIWDLFSYSIKYTLTGQNYPISCIKRVSSNMIASGDENGKIIVWNWLTGERIFSLIGHTKRLELNSLDLYDEQTLISGSLDKTVKFWNFTSGKLIRSITVDIHINALTMLKSSEWKQFKS